MTQDNPQRVTGRRWYQRGWVWVLIVLGAIVIVGAISDAGTETSDGTTTTDDGAQAAPTSEATTTTPSEPPGSTTSEAPGTTTTTFDRLPDGERAVVASITDGDTVDVDILGTGIDTVRLIGINSPERSECFADEASIALAGLLRGEEFTMTIDASDRDRYNRLLRYLWLDDGTFINEAMVLGGYAIARDYPPDSAHAARLAAAQSEAEAAEVGLWAPDACGPESTSDVEIVHVEYDAPGDDNTNLNGEWVDIANAGTISQAMNGWVLKDESATHRYTFPSTFTLGAGQQVRVYTGCGTDTTTELYWCNTGSAVWNNSGDTAFLLDANGNIVDVRPY